MSATVFGMNRIHVRLWNSSTAFKKACRTERMPKKSSVQIAEQSKTIFITRCENLPNNVPVYFYV